MDEKVKRPLPVSAVIKKLPPSFLADVQRVSLLAALLFACGYAGFAAYNLTRHTPSCQPCYALTTAADADAAGGLLRGLMWCSAPQGAAAALALLLPGLRRRALAFVALAATAANHGMYARLLGLVVGVDAPGALSHAVETASVFIAAALDLLGLLALLLGGDQ